jgi:predicted flap endonuclease-1-like 5' DNA nuclease
MVSKRGIIVWISAFVTFLAIMASFSMAVLLINEGAGTIVNPYILSAIFGGLTTETYLWISIAGTFALLGLTCILIYMKQPPDPEIVKLLLKVGGNLAALRKAQEASTNEIVERMEYDKKVNQTFFSKVTTDLQEKTSEMASVLDTQGRSIKKIRSELVSAVEAKTVETGEKLSADLKKQEAVLNSLKRLNEENATILKTQRAELEEITKQLEQIEGTMVPNQALLKSVDNPEDIKGIGPALGKELRELGITSVGEFLNTDPVVIGEKTRVSNEMAENLQATAQLMMVPGLDDDDAELLIDCGVKSRKQLADQDLITLSRKINDLAKIYIAQQKLSKEKAPTIEEISAWIRMAK